MQSYIFEVRYTLEMSIFEEFYALLANLTHVRNSILFLILYFKHLLKFALPSASLINNFQTYFNLTMSKMLLKTSDCFSMVSFELTATNFIAYWDNVRLALFRKRKNQENSKVNS